jgi:hypothetical protein
MNLKYSDIERQSKTVVSKKNESGQFLIWQRGGYL